MANHVGGVDAQNVHELAHMVDQVGERELLVEDVAQNRDIVRRYDRLFDTPFPYSLEHEYLPNPDRVLAAIRQTLEW